MSTYTKMVSLVQGAAQHLTELWLFEDHNTDSRLDPNQVSLACQKMGDKFTFTTDPRAPYMHVVTTISSVQSIGSFSQYLNQTPLDLANTLNHVLNEERRGLEYGRGPKDEYTIYYPHKNLSSPFYGTLEDAKLEVVVRNRIFQRDLVEQAQFNQRQARQTRRKIRPPQLFLKGKRILVEGYDASPRGR